MDVSSTLHTVLFIALIVAVIALIVFLVELIKTVRSAHKLVDDTQAKLQPTLEHVETISNDLKPAVAKVDPLVERLQLTVDAANVELMRVDKILEDVGDVTDTASNTAKTIDSVTSMPQKIVQDATTRVRGIVSGNRSSDEARKLAAAKAERDQKESDDADPASKAASHVKQSAADIVSRLVSGGKKASDEQDHAHLGAHAAPDKEEPSTTSTTDPKTRDQASQEPSADDGTSDASGNHAYFTYGNVAGRPSSDSATKGADPKSDASEKNDNASSTPQVTNDYGVTPAPSEAPTE